MRLLLSEQQAGPFGIINGSNNRIILLAIKRMENRRRMPKIMHSDNASEMLLAKSHIKALYKNRSRQS